MKKPKVSIIICTFNGAKNISLCLSAIMKQTYGNTEIIVVNDGSNDNTAEIVSTFSVKHVMHKKNEGLAESRNTGITHSTGEIIAFTDDDCIPQPDWIEQLTAKYTSENIAGVGGIVKMYNSQKNMILHYIYETNPLKPLSASLLVSNNLIYRLILYLSSLYTKTNMPKEGKAYLLVGANMSFRKEVLIKVGKFDKNFRFGGEEEDVCKRIHNKKLGSLLYTNKSVILHNFDSDFKTFFKKQFMYGQGSARLFYKHKSHKPTIFPFPLVIVSSVLASLFHPYFLFISLILPGVLYFNWVLHFVKSKKLYIIVFPYIQFLGELADDIGFLRGYIKYRNLYKTKI